MRRNAKPFYKMAEEAEFPFQVGRLIGATELSSFLLLNQENPDVKQIGTNLENVVSWFFESGMIKNKMLEQGSKP